MLKVLFYQKTRRLWSNDSMHATGRWLSALAVGVAACASSPSSHAIVVAVTELRQPGRPRPIAGDHYYRIRVTNRSAEAIVVDRIHIEPAGITEADVEDATQQFGESIGPDETRPFDMPIRVLSNRGTQDAFTPTIDSLRVMIEAHNEQGSFSDSGDYGVGVERPGGGGGESASRVRHSNP